jgi:hypothetical protein
MGSEAFGWFAEFDSPVEVLFFLSPGEFVFDESWSCFLASFFPKQVIVVWRL